ncbi:phosphate ABC transporter permease PstA [Anaerotignum sp.]|nr:phosphate ABC transporter permease PstA [Anaerotignum sp.]MBQ7758501.1 phosphate ABC transporter permease PstA [Anaerotignum sp.]
MEHIEAINTQSFKERLASYKRSPLSLFLAVLVILSAVITLTVLVALIVYILAKGIPNLKPELFEWEYNTTNVSMMPAIINTLTITAMTLIFAVPAGICSAIYLVEYAKRGNKFVSVVRMTTETLSGIPSIVFGLFGYLFFNIYLGWGYSILGGSLTLAIMVLPLIMRTTEEALQSVPDAYREGSFGLGAGKLRTVFRVVLPSAVPGILAGVILAVGRIVGETAALLYPAGTAAQVADGFFSSGRTLAVHMYALLNEGLYMDQAYATAVVLLVMVVCINALSSFIAKKAGVKA